MLKSAGIARRMGVAFGVVLLVVIGVVALALGSVIQLGGTFDRFVGTAEDSLRAGELNERIATVRLNAFAYRATRDEAKAQAATDALDGARSAAAALREGGVDPEKLDALDEELSTYGLDLARAAALGVRRQEAKTVIERRLEDVRRTLRQLAISSEGASRMLNANMSQAGDDVMAASLAYDRFLSGGAESVYAEAGASVAAAVEKLELALGLALTDDLRTGLEAALGALRELAVEAEDLRAIEMESRGLMQALDEIGPRMKADVAALLEDVVLHQSALGEAADRQAAQAQAVVVLVGAAGLLVGGLMAWRLGRRITGDVSALAQDMTRIGAGDLSFEIEATGRGPELDAMAGALRGFREAAIRERADAAAQRRRAEASTELQKRLGEVVGAAASGDFSRRIEARFGDKDLDEVAEAVNRLTRSVQAGVAETARVLARVAEGDLTERMTGEFAGAFADLQRDVNATVERLSAVIAEIAETGGDIDGAAREIAESARDVSRRAEQQAAAVEQTSATMEEMTASVRSNAENAERARGLAKDAVGFAEEGRGVVALGDRAMKEIKASSERIAEIVSLIDSIAFTTNLLALNASVEAARAGEAGKGFAVVASEVRTLAGRAADAARDIRELVETSGRHVSDGVSRMEETAGALSRIAEGVARMASAVEEISQASREQATGVGEITQAVARLDQTTQANAAVAEESAAAASTLTGQAEKLRDLVGAFRRRQGPRPLSVAAE